MGRGPGSAPSGPRSGLVGKRVRGSDCVASGDPPHLPGLSSPRREGPGRRPAAAPSLSGRPAARTARMLSPGPVHWPVPGRLSRVDRGQHHAAAPRGSARAVALHLRCPGPYPQGQCTLLTGLRAHSCTLDLAGTFSPAPLLPARGPRSHPPSTLHQVQNRDPGCPQACAPFPPQAPKHTVGRTVCPEVGAEPGPSPVHIHGASSELRVTWWDEGPFQASDCKRCCLLGRQSSVLARSPHLGWGRGDGWVRARPSPSSSPLSLFPP